MNTPHPGERAYALRLNPPAVGTPTLSGRLEHVVSGRCLDFNGGSELLAWLWHEQHAAPACASPSLPLCAPLSTPPTRGA